VIGVLAQDYPVTAVCEILELARSSYYYQPTVSPDEAHLREEIKKTSAEWPRYGYRRITAQLRRGKWRVNRKRVQRLMREMSIRAQIKRKKRCTTNSEHGFPRYPNLVLNLTVDHRSRSGSVISPTSICTPALSTWRCSWTSSLAVSVGGIWGESWITL